MGERVKERERERDAAPLAPGRAARRSVLPLFDQAGAGPPRRCRATSTTSPSATRAAAALLVLGLPALHWMVRRDGVVNDDAQGCRRGLPSTQSAGLARAQGCLAPRAGGPISALGAAVWS